MALSGVGGGNRRRLIEIDSKENINQNTATTINCTDADVDSLKKLYPAVNEDKTPLPRAWSSKEKYNYIGLSQNNLRVHYKGHGKTHRDAASVQATHPIPAACGLYYFEVKIVSKGRDGYMGIGLSALGVNMNRLPGWDKQSYGYHGDDGHSFCSSGTGQPYGPTFTTGDVIGCGVNLIDNTCFYTKNGHHLGTAFTDLPPNLYPTVGLQTPGEVVDANFGQEPFVFDIEDMMKELRSRTRMSIYDFPVPSQGEWQAILNKIVSTYLIHHGYCNTAAAFANVTEQPFNEDITSIKNRQKILKLVLAGRMGEAIEKTTRLYPGLLDRNQNLLFMLKCRQFIEMVNGSDVDISTSSSSTSNTNRWSNYGNISSSTGRSSNTPPPLVQQQQSVIHSTKSYNNKNNKSNAIVDELNHNNVAMNGSSNNCANGDAGGGGGGVDGGGGGNLNVVSGNSSTDSIIRNDDDVVMSDPSEDQQQNGRSETSYNGKITSTNGYQQNGNNNTRNNQEQSQQSNNSCWNDDVDVDDEDDEDEDMDVDVVPLIRKCTKPAVERILEFGRELYSMSQRLDLEHGVSERNQKMLEDAFSLLAYSNPWASPVGWQLDPVQRETVCASLNSAILETNNKPRKPPLEVAIAHAEELVRLMSTNGLGSCAFASIKDLLEQH